MEAKTEQSIGERIEEATQPSKGQRCRLHSQTSSLTKLQILVINDDERGWVAQTSVDIQYATVVSIRNVIHIFRPEPALPRGRVNPPGVLYEYTRESSKGGKDAKRRVKKGCSARYRGRRRRHRTFRGPFVNLNDPLYAFRLSQIFSPFPRVYRIPDAPRLFIVIYFYCFRPFYNISFFMHVLMKYYRLYSSCVMRNLNH